MLKKLTIEAYKWLTRLLGVGLMLSAVFISASVVDANVYTEGFHTNDTVRACVEFCVLFGKWAVLTLVIGTVGAALILYSLKFDVQEA